MKNLKTLVCLMVLLCLNLNYSYSQKKQDLILYNKTKDKTIVIGKNQKLKVTLKNGDVLKGSYLKGSNNQLIIGDHKISYSDIHLIKVPKTGSKTAVIGAMVLYPIGNILDIINNRHFSVSRMSLFETAAMGAGAYYVLKRNIYNIEST